ncbi:MAG TPA: divergent polysaccharide deacetylase family protein [Stellaceae bacterium]|nr:divergent polysaccharide deacetylase family protein [Stellaceae bacterium]
MEVRWEEDGRKPRWRLWVGLLAAAALAGLVAGLYQNARDKPTFEVQSPQGASAPILPAPQIENGTAAPQQAAHATLPAWLVHAVPAPPVLGKPRVALVIDDLGLDRARTERALKLKGPLTLVFLAYAGALPQQAEAARKAGDEVLLHVATGGMNPTIAVGPGQMPGAPPPEETLRRLRWDLDRLPAYVGVDLPAAVPTDPQYMPIIMDELKARGLLFLDNRSDAATSALAQSSGVPYVARDATLDGQAADVDENLARLEALARKNGAAIAVGHANDRTLAALQRWLPTLAKKGIVLVPLSDIAKTRNAPG